MEGLVLDCGTGDNIFAPYLGGDKIIHLDVDMTDLRKIPGLRVVASAAAVPFKDDAFDSLWACAGVEHVKEDTIPEFQRVVKRDGQIAVLTPNRYSPADFLRRLLGLPYWWKCEGHVRLYSLRELRKYGAVYGEIWQLPFIDKLVRRLPPLGDTLMLCARNRK